MLFLLAEGKRNVKKDNYCNVEINVCNGFFQWIWYNYIEQNMDFRIDMDDLYKKRRNPRSNIKHTETVVCNDFPILLRRICVTKQLKIKLVCNSFSLSFGRLHMYVHPLFYRKPLLWRFPVNKGY